MEVIIRDTRAKAVELTARLIDRAVSAWPEIVLGLATGGTMEDVYGKMAQLHAAGGADYARVRTFNLDEYIGLDPDDPCSYHAYMRRHLFGHINIDMANAHLPKGAAPDIDAECLDYERRIEECGGIDLQLLGIGRSGHIGFNEPLSAMRSRTRAKALTPLTIEQNQHYFPSPELMPRRAITMGVGTILDSRRCILLATGKEKARIVAAAVEGPVTSMISASALQLHPACTIIVDEEAASDLTQCEYYHWTFENEPEWQEYQ